MAEHHAISSPFFRQLVTVATIAVGVIYIERSVTTTVDNAIEKALTPINEKVKSYEPRITGLEQKSVLNEYKWNIYESEMKSFIKPEEPTIRRKR